MKAIVLAAGRGERLRPLTDATPKPLLRAGGRALIEWQVEALVAGGFDQLLVNHAHLGGQIVEALGKDAATTAVATAVVLPRHDKTAIGKGCDIRVILAA